MRTIRLNTKEQELLIDILECCLSDIRMEIAGTENWKFKQGLHQRKSMIIHLLDKFQVVKAENKHEAV